MAALSMPAFVQAQSPAPSPEKSPLLSTWWNGDYFTGNWFGARDALAENGITFHGEWVGVYYGIVDSQTGAHSAFDQEIELGGHVDFAKLTKSNALKGLEGFVQGRYRQAIDPNDYVLASSNFQPSHMESGFQWRILSFGLTYTTPELFGMKDFLTVTGGWLQPQEQFITQPLSKEFVNSTFESSKGIGEDIPFSSSFSTWGGVLQVKPVDWYYAKGALFMAFPQATESSNHGLAFQGFAKDPSTNGLMAMMESGFTPKIGPSKLDGKYVFGSYWYTQSNESYNGAGYPGFYGFYWQVDQRLYREPTTRLPSAGKQVIASDQNSELSDQGLSTFNLFTYSPGYNQPLSFYFHSGLVYRGLIPARDKDQLMAAWGFGTYSYENIRALQEAGNVNQPNYTGVLELDYRVQVNAWFYFQPYMQYIIKPNGTGAVENATILGFMTGVTF